MMLSINQKKISQYQDIDIKNDAAIKIQQFFKKIRIAKIYNNMIEKSKDFNNFTIGNNNKLSILDKFNYQISLHHLCSIKKQLGEITPQEKKVICKIITTPFLFQHQTINNLENFNTHNNCTELVIKSHKYLSRENSDIEFNSHTYDIDSICNNDFVFFSICMSNNPENKPEITTHALMDFGYIAYLINEKYGKNGYLTLTDQACCFVYPDTNYLTSKFKGLEKLSKRRIAISGSNAEPIFSYQHMKLGIGYYLILFLRNCDIKEFIEYVYTVSTTKEINYIVHTLFNLEYHIPKEVKIFNDFYKHILYTPTLKQAVNCVGLFTLRRFCFSNYDSFTDFYHNILVSKTHSDIIVYFEDLFQKILKEAKYLMRDQIKLKMINILRKDIEIFLNYKFKEIT
jgi:hypothetical protein